MRRRKFVQSMLTVPGLAVPAAASAQQTSTPPAPATPPAPNPMARFMASAPNLKVTEVDVTSETVQHFFTPKQFATLVKLGGMLVPSLKGRPSAVEAQAPEFLDFLVSVAPDDFKKLYRDGLDYLDLQAAHKFHKPFAEIDEKQADEIIRPLLTVRYWSMDMPKDPHQRFMAQVHEDLMTATQNSREWAESSTSSGGRFGRFAGRGLYWKPIDPVS